MTVLQATQAGYSIQRHGKAWTLYLHGLPVFGAWRCSRLIAFIECREMVKRTLRDLRPLKLL